MIPGFNEHGWRPKGIHDCTLEEAAQRVGRFQGSERRPVLWARLLEFIQEAKTTGVLQEVLLNGSFVSAKPDPNDIDLILVVPRDHDFSADLLPLEYNVLSKRRVQRRYGFDLLVARAGSAEYDRYITFFQQVRFEPDERKGILRIRL